jgi:hypothetical protein
MISNIGKHPAIATRLLRSGHASFLNGGHALFSADGCSNL